MTSLLRLLLHWRRLLGLSIAAAVFSLSANGVFVGLDNSITSLRQAAAPHASDIDATVVAIDAKSLLWNSAWPWDREIYAALMDRLAAAGAEQVAFDIDFSAPRDGDEAFADALRRAGLPAYGASVRRELKGVPGLFSEHQPNETLAPYLLPVVADFVSDADGVLRRFPDQTVFSSGAVPALAHALAGRQPVGETVLLDASHRPENVPVLSFADIINGQFDPELIRARVVLIGATAPELGDEFAVPVHGLTPGVVMNAMAYHNVVEGRFPRSLPWAALPLIALCASLPLVRLRDVRVKVLLNVVLFGFVVAGGYILQERFGLIVSVAAAHTAQLVALTIAFIAAMDLHARENFRQQMEIAQKAGLLEAVFKENEEGLLIVDGESRVLAANEKAASFIGSARAELLGACLSDAVPLLTPPAQDAPQQRSIALKSADGAGFSLEVSFATVNTARGRSRHERRSSPRMNTLIVMHDVTARESTLAAERAARQVHEEASKQKSMLLNMMSHELRTPLNHIIGFSDMIASEALGAHSDKEYGAYAKYAAEGGRRLLSIVGDMMHAAAFQSGEHRLRRESVCLRRIGEGALGRARARMTWADPACLDATLPELEIFADGDLLSLGLSHLLENAVKFAGAGATVTVTAAADGDCLSLTVADNGPGLSGKDAEQLFEPLKQPDCSLSRRSDGCGLGLYLVREIARAHGGDAEVRAEGGFAVTMTLADAFTHKPRSGRAPSATRRLHPIGRGERERQG